MSTVFSCLSTKIADWYFVYPFSRSEYFVLLHYRQKIDGFFLSTLSLSFFFPQPRNLSTFFTVRMFCSVTAYVWGAVLLQIPCFVISQNRFSDIKI